MIVHITFHYDFHGMQSMTNQQKELVKNTFSLIAPQADVAAELFYGRLFTIAPHLRPLFRNDIKDQGKKLMSMLAMVVGSLYTLEKLIPILEQLGRRHAQYGVQAEHFAPVGEALLWTLQKGLGHEFTQDAEQAWTAAFMLIMGVMTPAMELETI